MEELQAQNYPQNRGGRRPQIRRSLPPCCAHSETRRDMVSSRAAAALAPHATLRRGHIRWARVRAPPYRALQVFSSLCSARRSGGQSQAGHACPCCDLILDSSVPPLSLSAFACAIRLPCLQDRTILYPLLFSSFPTPCLGHTHTPSQEDYD
jgi:hypothetical protein